MKGDPLYSRWLLLCWVRQVNRCARYSENLSVTFRHHAGRLVEKAIEDYHLKMGHIRKGKLYPDKMIWLKKDGSPLTTSPKDFI